MKNMPASPPPAPQYLTKVPQRGANNMWKLHNTLGHAKLALWQGSQNSWAGKVTMEIYYWATDESTPYWKLLYSWTYGEPRPW